MTATNPTRWSNSTLRPVWWTVGAVLRLPLEVNVKGGYHGLRCYVGQTKHKNDQPCTSPLGNTPSKIDVCDYLGGQLYPAARLAFCPNTYKPPSSNDEMTSKNSESCNGWMDLRRDLSIAAHDAGNPIVSN